MSGVGHQSRTSDPSCHAGAFAVAFADWSSQTPYQVLDSRFLAKDGAPDRPVSVGVRLVSVIGDEMQHAGQAAYLRGLIERLRLSG